MMLEYTDFDLVAGRRLICPEALGGCGAACDGDDGSRTDWICAMCNKEWNIHDAETALMELEE